MKPNLNVNRRRVRKAMTGGCRVFKLGGWVYDPVTKTEVQEEVERYVGPCWMRPRVREPQDVRAGAETVTVTDYEVWLPVDALVPEDGLLVEMMHSIGDTSLIGVRFHVVDAVLDDWQVSRRLICKRHN